MNAALNMAQLTNKELSTFDAYWRACNYLAPCMIYLRDNLLLRKPLKPEHIKQRLLGHWGSSPGLSFVYIHINCLIIKYDLNAIFLAGPRHGALGVLAPINLEGTYSEVYSNKGEDEEGLRHFFKEFSLPGGIKALIFTSGRGEHSAEVRALICNQLVFLGFSLNEVANQSHLMLLNEFSSKPILIIPADEEAEIARLSADLIVTNSLYKNDMVELKKLK